jgi:hypothetical protein|tara:strand:+ start:194 stop:514 length:321 start_codon:yes stop_codon:yes gene_type:complete
MNTLEEVSSIQEMPKKETRGRPAGVKNIKNYKWDVTVFDKTTNTFKREKCITIADINEKFGLKLNSDYVKRIVTKYRADMSMKNKENSFLARWGFIQIEKIYEPIV